MNKIGVFGLGYIGLPTASIFANNGYQVQGVDVNQNVVDTINKGQIHIKEPGLNVLVSAAVNSGNLVATMEPGICDVYVIAVPTPVDVDKKVRLDYVIQAAESIGLLLKKGDLVILESTSPPRTTVDVLLPLLEKSGLKGGQDFYLAHCPERVLPGNILHELVYNNRVIGGINEESSCQAKALYAKVVQGEIVLTDASSAEMAKLMENTFRDVNIALANELGVIAGDLGLDALEIIELANMHPRVNLHQPGPGVGGHCLAVDPWFIVEKSDNARLIRLAREINDGMPARVAREVIGMLKGIENPVVTGLGVAYKGNVDDTRESPALDVIKNLVDKGVQVKVYDPHVGDCPFPLLSLEDSFKDSDLALVLTDHGEFKFFSPEELGKIMRHKLLFDTRDCLDHNKWSASGFKARVLGNYN